MLEVLLLQTLPLGTGKKLAFWWFDAYVSPNNGSTVYLFGKVWDPALKSHVSACLRVNNMFHDLIVVPREYWLDGERERCVGVGAFRLARTPPHVQALPACGGAHHPFAMPDHCLV